MVARTMEADAASSRVQGNLFAFLGMFIWAMTYPITDILLRTWNPLSLAMTRVLCAGILLGFIAIFVRANRNEWRNWPIKDACLTGVIGLGLSTVLMNFAFQYSNAVNVAVISTMVPLVSAIMGMIRGEEQMTLRLGTALCLAIGGGVVVSVSNLDSELGFRGGELLMICAVVLWTWFSRVSVTKLRSIPPFPRMALALTVAGLALFPIVLIFHWTAMPMFELSWRISDVWLPVCLAFGVAFSTGFWMMSADRIGVTIAAIHVNVVPFYVVVLMILFGGFLNLWQLGGAILVAAGVILAQLNLGGETAAHD